MFNPIIHLIVAFFLLLPYLFVDASHGIPIHQECPVVPYTHHVLFGQIGPYASQPLYRISYHRDLSNLNPNITIDFVDIHLIPLPPLQGFFNYRMKTMEHLSFYIILPISILGNAFQYWFTTGTFLVQNQQQHFHACDSPTTTFTLPSTGTTIPPTSPPIVRAPGAVCPALIFTHSLDANLIGTNRYIITFTRSSGSPFVEWVDVHILTAGGFFNYRMLKETEMEFKHVLQFELLPGTSIVYWFTYSIPNEFETTGILPTRCDTSAYHVVISGSPSICPLLTFTHNVFYSVRYGGQQIAWNVTSSSSIRATTVFVHITHSSGDYTYQMFRIPEDPTQQSYIYILPQVLSKPNDTWTYSFTYNTDSGQTCTTETFTANT